MNYGAAKHISRILVGLVSWLLMTAPAFSQPAAGPEGNPQLTPGAIWTAKPLTFTDTGVAYSGKECKDHASLEPCTGFVALRIDNDRLLVDILQEPKGLVMTPIVLDTPVEAHIDVFGNRLFRANYAEADASPYVRWRGLDHASHISIRHDNSMLNDITAEYRAELENLGFDVTVARGVGTNFRTFSAIEGDNTLHMLLYRNDGGVTVRFLGY